MVSPIAAAKAYASVQNAAKLTGGQATETTGPSFADILKSSVGDAVSASRHAETQMTAHAQGKAELVNVVTSVASAEASLETVMAVRDQVISAYQEIMRMPI